MVVYCLDQRVAHLLRSRVIVLAFMCECVKKISLCDDDSSVRLIDMRDGDDFASSKPYMKGSCAIREGVLFRRSVVFGERRYKYNSYVYFNICISIKDGEVYHSYTRS